MSEVIVDQAKKDKLVKEAQRALKSLLMSGSDNVLDAHLFDPHLLVSFWNKKPLKTRKNHCKHFNRIRANRLKLYGYVWDSESESWVYQNE